ncbi:PP2C family protein-serine/threonine phosphatase [Actinokineospora terrae]|uniref:Stage II sporulation protein E (SpoIIE) n=1 Tax=Actinokineospora terrae TaxID=155974 RepID=A0A1H9XPD3_9PSEU|nr:GAF domain-containing SpoIIE family protein phosphatase [Actinokineospora terrae]SES47961.1 Stage II sporulation protein E (SpoIIE) [Actinokineospora terrae]
MDARRGSWHEVLSHVIDAAHRATATDLVDVVSEACARIGMQARLYLVDMAQRELHPLPPRGEPAGRTLGVDDTAGGRAFRLSEITVSEAGERSVLWVPIVNGTERLGVLALRLPRDTDPDDVVVRERCWTVAGLVGHLAVSKRAYSDLLHTVRRPRPLSVASELLWQLLPPQTFACRDLVVSATMEPYDRVGGDGFDYAVDDDRAYFAVLDATGHDLAAGLITTMVLAATRNARRQGGDLPAMAAAADEVLAGHPTQGVCTAVLADLDLATGELRYLLAGHPPPVLLRGGRLVGPLSTRPRVPLGMNGLHEPTRASGVGVEQLRQGDRLLLYTDGITEARDPDGAFFGVDRLVALTEHHEAAGLPAPETLRRVTRAVLDHQNGVLQDDATLVLVEWSPAASDKLLPRLRPRPGAPWPAD